MTSYVLGFRDIGKTDIMIAGGKGANLGELSKIEDVLVPDGFCISTEAFKRVMGATSPISDLLDQLSLLKVEDRDKIGRLSGEIRRVIEGIDSPQDITEEIARFLLGLGEKEAYAVRSSATAEDLPTASFAGQQETYLNVIGLEAILAHVSKCWASLYTERAVVYRLQHGFDHRKVNLAVVVQKMVFSQVSGILFTADPVTSNRKVLSIDASFGLGEALVAGLVNADNYKVRNGEITDKKIFNKKLAIHALQEGGTREQEIEPEQQNRQALTDDLILQLASMGRTIEEHFGFPQDVEWCLVDGTFYIVQSRPITTLFPIPEAGDQENHVYVSVGHGQMMTDAMKPLGLSFFLLMTPAPMRKAGGRLFVDVTHMLASPASRQALIDTMGKGDPLMKDALLTVVGREGFIKTDPDVKVAPKPGDSNRVISTKGFRTQLENDPTIASDLIRKSQTSIEALRQNIQTESGPELFDFILKDFKELRNLLTDPQSHVAILAAMDAAFWINEQMDEWLGEKNATDTISQSVPNNITSEMGLALLDLADVIRPYPEVVNYLQHVTDDNFLDELDRFEGGQEIRDGIYAYLEKYGMRCSGEIDITRTRWSEKPTTIIPMILSNIKNFEPGAGKRKFEQGRQEALNKEQELLHRLKQLADGEEKAAETKRMIDLIRNFAGYREFPKYALVSRYFVYKQALLKEAAQLVEAGVVNETEDIYYLTFEELHEVVRTQTLDYGTINERKEEHKLYEKLTPPRVITSEGENISGAYNREDIPTGAFVGLPVSSGVVEGRARVIFDMVDADLEDGDILVTAFTDPGWTPLFVSIKGLVTEVGGLMTHGAVIAREYGLPAVVGVEGATKLIKDGQRIRVHGTQGFVEIL